MVTGSLTGLLTSGGLRRARRGLAEVRRRARRAPLEVHYFHQVDDPYGQLAAQRLPDFAARYDIDLVPHLAGPPPDDAAPERERLAAFARKDAADIAPAYGLAFSHREQPPDPEHVALAQRILAAADRDQFVARAAAVGDALWAGDGERLRTHAAAMPPVDAAVAAERIAAGTARRAELGHYSGAMFYCEPEWYWGVDRLHYLEARLAGLGRDRIGGAPLTARRELVAMPSSPTDVGLKLHFYMSLRSPYSAIAMRRVLALGDRYPIEVVLKPVLPMVMRGLPVPPAKRIYIVLDTKREAEAAGVPFGRICDPVGEPVERGFSLYRWARDNKRAGEYLTAFLESVFAEGVDAGTEDGLRQIVERAGLDWEPAQAHREKDAWRAELETNRRELFDHGLWGVPSFRLSGGGAPDFSTWGQDRIWLVEQEIRRRV